MSLKQVFDKVNPFIPTQREIEPLIEYDRDRKKLDVFLSLHKKTLTVADIKVYMPFTINLDPYLRKVIKEEVQNMEELGVSMSSKSTNDQDMYQPLGPSQTKPILTRRQAVELTKKMSDMGVSNPNILPPTLSVTHPYMGLLSNYNRQQGMASNQGRTQSQFQSINSNNRQLTKYNKNMGFTELECSVPVNLNTIIGKFGIGLTCICC